MPSATAYLATAAMALFASVDAHMTMNKPQLYNPSTVQSSPLNGVEYQFPCQIGASASGYGSARDGTPVTAGASTEVAFTGSAVHGGGVCQFVVTYDFPPPADKTKWKVIHTIIGGCPASAAGNIATSGADSYGRPNGQQCGDDSSKECVRSFDIPIPKQLKNGQATFAWVWFNKIGNREMYMNCAPISVSGGSSDDSFFNSLPQMFVANIPGQCSTGQGLLDIPNAGQSVVKNETPTPGSLGTCPATGYGGSSGSPSPSQPPSSPSSSASTTAKPSPSSGASNPGGIFAPGASSPKASTTSFATVSTKTAQATAVPSPGKATTPAPQQGQSPATGELNNNTNNSKACPTGSIPCSNPGAMVCSSDTLWGTCDIDNCAVLRRVAEGTICSKGAVAAAVPNSRRRHIFRRHGAGHRFHARSF